MYLIFLQVWYAPHYAERFGFPQLDITDQDIQSECMCKANIHVHVFCFKYRGYRGSGSSAYKMRAF